MKRMLRAKKLRDEAAVCRDVEHACGPDRAAQGEAAPRVADLLLPGGRASLLARRLDGRMVALRGYVAPSIERAPAVVRITDRSSATCAICGALHDPGSPLAVAPVRPVPPGALAPEEVPPERAVRVIGRLELSGRDGAGAARPRIADARFEPLGAPAARRPSPARAPSAASARARASGTRGVHADASSRQRRSGDHGPAEVILRGGRVHTLCEALGSVEAVAIRNGRFLAVGSSESVSEHAGAGTEIVELRGKTVVPGLIDSHLHQIMLALNLPAVDLLGARSIAEVQARIAERAAETPPGQWVVASSGWHESMLAEGRMPTRWELDAAAPGYPVMVPRGGHVVTASSTALAAAGITAETPDPAGGVIVRDPATGETTGVLLESAAGFVRARAPEGPAPEQLAEQLVDAMRLLNSYGVVSVVDPSVDDRICEVYKRLREQGRLTVRTDLLYKVRDLEETRKAIAYALAQRSDHMLRFPGIKFMLDGGVEGARMSAPYRIVPGEQPHPDYRGLLLTPPGGREELMACYRLVAEAGLQAQTHGVGDEAIDFIAGCYADVAREHDIGALHWCLMHVFLPSEGALAKLKAAGVMLTVQDHPVLLGHNQRRWWGDERAARSIPIRDLIDAGLLVGGGTDGPVVPVDPFLSMGWMVTRTTLRGDTLGAQQAITAREALELYTLNNARILGVADDRGSIEPGRRADLAVLSQDVLAVAPEAIRDTRALLTMVDGRVVYRAEG